MVRMCKPPDICCDDKRRQGLACVLEVLVRDHELRMSRGDGPGQLWSDILIHAEEVGRIVFLLHRRQARQIQTERGVNNLFGFVVERRK